MIKDQDLLQLLKENARISNSDLAQMLNVSKDAVSKKIKKLEHDGVIQGYTTLINEDKLTSGPRKIKALVEVGVQPEKNKGFDNIAKQVLKYNNVVDHFLISGSYDFLIVVEGESLQEISEFISAKLSSLKNIKSTMTHFILKKYKENSIVYENGSSGDRLMMSL